MEGNGRITTAILIGVWLTFALDVFSAFCSSPQTTQINATKRADSLMHWVRIATGVAVGVGAGATIVSKKPWPLLATASASGAFYLLYVYAKKKGLAEAAGGAPATESY